VFELLAISARGGLGKYVQREGGMEPLVWDGQEPQILFQVKTAPVGNAVSEPESERNRLTYQLELLRLGLSSAYRIEHELLGSLPRVQAGADVPGESEGRRDHRSDSSAGPLWAFDLPTPSGFC
jgi:predicted ATPase